MRERMCDTCRKKKGVRGGKTCESGHFICKECIWTKPGYGGPEEHKSCPICKKPLNPVPFLKSL